MEQTFRNKCFQSQRATPLKITHIILIVHDAKFVPMTLLVVKEELTYNGLVSIWYSPRRRSKLLLLFISCMILVMKDILSLIDFLEDED